MRRIALVVALVAALVAATFARAGVPVQYDSQVATQMAKAICIDLRATQVVGWTFSHWHCQKDQVNPYVGMWEYSIWVVARHDGISRWLYMVMYDDESVYEMAFVHHMGDTGGLVG